MWSLGNSNFLLCWKIECSVRERKELKEDRNSGCHLGMGIMRLVVRHVGESSWLNMMPLMCITSSSHWNMPD